MPLGCNENQLWGQQVHTFPHRKPSSRAPATGVSWVLTFPKSKPTCVSLCIFQSSSLPSWLSDAFSPGSSIMEKPYWHFSFMQHTYGTSQSLPPGGRHDGSPPEKGGPMQNQPGVRPNFSAIACGSNSRSKWACSFGGPGEHAFLCAVP